MTRAVSRPAKTHFFCSACGNEETRWFGRCASCGAWNTAAEAPAPANAGGAPSAARGGKAARARWAPQGGEHRPAGPRPLAAVHLADADRVPTGLGEFDRVLGGGIMPGSIVLVGGDPGIGKSTLMLQLAGSLAGAGRKVLYVSGEESEEQVRLRAARLGPVPDSLLILTETDLEQVLDAAAAVRPDAMVVDSIQTISRGDLEGGPGTVSQVRECALALLHFAKGSKSAVFLVGHVTKEGAVAGPRVLEHMVDAVLYLEGERYQHYRVLRAAKNRFGSTNELGVYEMLEGGLREVANPSEAFLSHGAGQRTEPGSAVVASIEGSRPLLVEVQALVATSFYGTPQRVTSGYDARRLAVLLAVLERRVGLRLGRHDVFVTVTGGLSLDEPGTDLGVALAIASSFLSRPVLEGTLALGEVSLSGELRRVSRIEARVREAAQLGFRRAGVPAMQADDARLPGPAPSGSEGGFEIVPLTTLREGIERLLGEKVLARRGVGEPERGRDPAGAGEPAREAGR
jgi:DNA repair protein RadA/Sms